MTLDPVRAFLGRLDHLSVDDLSVLALGPPDPSERDRLRERAETAAEDAGRLDEFDAAAERAVALAIEAFSFRGYEPTWFGPNWGRSLGRVDDRARLLAAIEDAALAAVVADLVPNDAEALSEPFELAASMAGTAPTSNPASDAHPNLVRVAWVVAAFPWIVLSTQVLFVVAARILNRSSNLFG